MLRIGGDGNALTTVEQAELSPPSFHTERERERERERESERERERELLWNKELERESESKRARERERYMSAAAVLKATADKVRAFGKVGPQATRTPGANDGGVRNSALDVRASRIDDDDDANCKRRRLLAKSDKLTRTLCNTCERVNGGEAFL